ncbi:phosphatase PAP2 family protein [Candidatus Uhrbacteria bacterium]|nr:phosphatase PAP2 family protein [Candidatus Uhrbacteria bacterium]
MSFDQTLSRNIYRIAKDSWILRPLAIFCANTLLFIMITAIVFTCSALDCDADFWRRTQGHAFTLGLPLFITWLVTFFLQKTIKRARPFEQGRDEPLIKMVWIEPSFPSAHSAVAFATAVVGSYFYWELFGPWLFFVAIAVAISRVAVGVHYMSDVFFGALLGVMIGSSSLFALLWLVFFSPFLH